MRESFREEFGDNTAAAIARRLDVTEAGVKNYLEGRVTLPIVIEISNLTKRSVDWLLTGEGNKYISFQKNLDLDQTFRSLLREMINEELDRRESEKNNTKEEKMSLTKLKSEKKA